jgi:hypothetical protein
MIFNNFFTKRQSYACAWELVSVIQPLKNNEYLIGVCLAKSIKLYGLTDASKLI